VVPIFAAAPPDLCKAVIFLEEANSQKWKKFFFLYLLWPISTQMNRLINSFATSAYRIMTGVKRLDKVRNTMVLRSVSRSDLIHSTWSTTSFPRIHAPKYRLPTCQYLCATPANTWNNKTWPSSTKLRGLHQEADWNEGQRALGGVSRPWSLAWTCGRVHWSTTARLEIY